jgi:hypothetical protein
MPQPNQRPTTNSRPTLPFSRSVPARGHLPSRGDSWMMRRRVSHGLASAASASRRFATQFSPTRLTTSRNATTCTSHGCQPMVSVPTRGTKVAKRRQALTDTPESAFRPHAPTDPAAHHEFPSHPTVFPVGSGQGTPAVAWRLLDDAASRVPRTRVRGWCISSLRDWHAYRRKNACFFRCPFRLFIVRYEAGTRPGSKTLP